ncbi:MAG: NAD(P)H-hydrate dehydratase [Rubrivivax sp.]|nr:NAD(P)H-hydrate dehydratase [Rubrivivax sp.]
MSTALLAITPLNGPWPLHDTSATRELEAPALAARTGGVLMASAGLAVARLALAMAPTATRVHVWAGPGNNGGDGLVAARHLHAAGLAVVVSLLADPARLPTDARRAWQDAQAAGVPVHSGIAAAADADLHIDALLGLGASRAPQGDIAAAIELLNRQTAPVLAVDLPSGLHADTGALLGTAAIQAQATLALLTLKPGCFTHQGRDCAGAVWLADLGVTPSATDIHLSGPPPTAYRPHAAHKGSRGDVLVVGGALGMAGALELAAGAALAAGAGRVYVSRLADEPGGGWEPPLARPELMLHPRAWLAAPQWLSSKTVVCGCGGGDVVRSALPPLLAHATRLVLDADALNAIATDPMLLHLLRKRQARRQPTLCTPHPLEAARLLGLRTAQVQQDRLSAARALAEHLHCTVLLKGSGSVIATCNVDPAPPSACWINSTGNAALATAGTGDVLAGWAGGLWVQQPDSAPQAIAIAAAWQHGHAADGFAHSTPGRALRAAELIERLAAGQ